MIYIFHSYKSFLACGCYAVSKTIGFFGFYEFAKKMGGEILDLGPEFRILLYYIQLQGLNTVSHCCYVTILRCSPLHVIYLLYIYASTDAPNPNEPWSWYVFWSLGKPLMAAGFIEFPVSIANELQEVSMLLLSEHAVNWLHNRLVWKTMTGVGKLILLSGGDGKIAYTKGRGVSDTSITWIKWERLTVKLEQADERRYPPWRNLLRVLHVRKAPRIYNYYLSPIYLSPVEKCLSGN